MARNILEAVQATAHELLEAGVMNIATFRTLISKTNQRDVDGGDKQVMTENSNICYSSKKSAVVRGALPMNVSLTSELENYVKLKVATGMYTSASEVMREALRLMEERDTLQSMKLESLRGEIARGDLSIEEGKAKPLDFEAVKAAARAHHQKRAK